MGKRDAPSLELSSFDPTTAVVSVASQDRFEGVALGTVVLVGVGEVGERI